MSKFKLYFFLLLGLFVFLGCKVEPIDAVTVEDPSLDTDDTAISLEGELQISDFVWQGLNEFYYWQEEVTDLADTKKEDSKAYAQYINQNSDPVNEFKLGLLLQPIYLVNELYCFLERTFSTNLSSELFLEDKLKSIASMRLLPSCR